MMNSSPKPIRVLQPGATVKAREIVTRTFDGADMTRHYYGKGRWRTMPTDRRTLRRQADKISEQLEYIKAHLLNMHEAYKDAADVQDTTVLYMIAMVEFVAKEWDLVRTNL